MFSESLEMLQSMLQIDHTMTTRKIVNTSNGTALGLLCARIQFPFIKEMVVSLIEVDRSVAVIYSGILECMRRSNANTRFTDISPGSGGEKMYDLIQVLLNASPEAAYYNNSNIFHEACCNLRGQLGIAVVTFFLTKNSDGLRSLSTDGNLPVHYAASCSTVDMLAFLHEAYPESLSVLVPNDESNLLHFATKANVDKVAKMQYLCDQCPQLIHMKNNEGYTPLHDFLRRKTAKALETVNVLCNADETVLMDKCTPSNIDHANFDSLPLHRLISLSSSYRYHRSLVSDEADCFRLFLRLYPSSAGMQNGRSKSPYDLAVTKI
jgi:hypothetical protein